jgi:D-serine deaminase-like pyridoxal phosphate-dependent protein
VTTARTSLLERASQLVDRERGRLRDAYGGAIGQDVHDLPTPMLLLDLPAAPRNIDRMAEGIATRHSALRPHIKVHKSPDLSRLQVQAGAIGLSVATVWEALVMAASGIDDLFVVNTVAGSPKVRLLAALARERRVLLAVDDAENARSIAAIARDLDADIGLLVEVDTGMDRAGVDTPEDAVALAQVVIDLEGVYLAGLTGYEGHCSVEDDVARRTVLQREAMRRLMAARDALGAAGLPCPIVSAGGTRTWWLTAATPGVTEVQAGTYVVMDAFHSGLEGGFEHALHIGTSVISRAPGRLIVDVGSKTVAASDLCRLEEHDLTVVRFDEEHGIFASSAPEPRVGTFLRMVPGYGPSTVASFDVFHVVEGDRVVDIWPVIPRGPDHIGLGALLEGRGDV